MPVPTVISFVDPFKVTELDPTVNIPVTLASPLTYKDVPEAPTAPTSRVNLGLVVPIPTLERVLMPELTISQVPRDRVVPSPKYPYNSEKLSLIFPPAALKLSP